MQCSLNLVFERVMYPSSSSYLAALTQQKYTPKQYLRWYGKSPFCIVGTKKRTQFSGQYHIMFICQWKQKTSKNSIYHSNSSNSFSKHLFWYLNLMFATVENSFPIKNSPQSLGVYNGNRNVVFETWYNLHSQYCMDLEIVTY